MITFPGKHWGNQHSLCRRTPELLKCSSVPLLSRPGLTEREVVTELGTIDRRIDAFTL